MNARCFCRLGIVLGLSAGFAGASPFPIVGGSYTVPVEYRLWWNGQQGLPMSSATGAMSGCATQQGAPANVADYAVDHWGISGLDLTTDTATSTVTLDSVYTINKIRLQYNGAMGWGSNDYELRTSADGTSWTTVVARTANPANSTVDNTFTAVDARYLQWQVWGPGASGQYLYMTEIMPYVASTAVTNIPQREQGYNVALVGTVYSQSGWQSWGPASSAINGNFWTDGATPAGANATAIYNLGASYNLATLRAAMYASWDAGKFEVSNDLVTWTTVYNGALTTGNYNFTPQLVQYIRVTGTAGAGNGHLRELAAFVMFPEPASLVLLGCAAAALLRRRRA